MKSFVIASMLKSVSMHSLLAMHQHQLLPLAKAYQDVCIVRDGEMLLELDYWRIVICYCSTLLVTYEENKLDQASALACKDLSSAIFRRALL